MILSNLVPLFLLYMRVAFIWKIKPVYTSREAIFAARQFLVSRQAETRCRQLQRLVGYYNESGILILSVRLYYSGKVCKW